MPGLIDRLLTLYLPPPIPMIEEMKSRASMIPADRVEDVYAAILEEANTSQKIGVKHIIDACKKLSISTRDYSSQFVAVKDWECDCCGKSYKYHPLPTAQEQVDRNWHSVCPMCGFQANWTITYRNYKLMGANPEWYQRLIDKYSTSYGPGKPNGIYFKRNQVARELQDLHEDQFESDAPSAESLRQKVAQVAQSKRMGIEA